MRINIVEPFKQLALVEAITSVYQQSFGGEPWNEGWLCPVCEKVFALSHSDKTCPECSKHSRTVLLVEYWPRNKVVSDFYHEMQKPDPICVVAQSDEKVVGFAWGYRVCVSPDLGQQLDAPDLHLSLKGDFFYLDECAVVPSCQGTGVGKLLVGYILEVQQQSQVLLRTMNDSRMCSLIKNMGGEIVQHISRGRVIIRLYTS